MLAGEIEQPADQSERLVTCFALVQPREALVGDLGRVLEPTHHAETGRLGGEELRQRPVRR